MRSLDEVLRAELSVFRAWSGKSALRILEVGVARSVDEAYRVGDGWSSVSLARDVGEYGGSLTGVDLDVSSARVLVEGEGLAEEFVVGHSLDVLAGFVDEGRQFDVVFLDGANDAGVVLEEFFLAEKLVAAPGVILADDMDEDDPEVVKGRLLVPFLRGEGRDFRMNFRETPWCTRDVLVFNVT